jgi:hypothetical protein
MTEIAASKPKREVTRVHRGCQPEGEPVIVAIAAAPEQYHATADLHRARSPSLRFALLRLYPHPLALISE